MLLKRVYSQFSLYNIEYYDSNADVLLLLLLYCNDEVYY